MTLGVLLMTYGAPASLEDLPRYLSSVRGGSAVSQELISEFRRRYEVIGGSPLVRITAAQAAALERELARDLAGVRVLSAMRHSEPKIGDQLHALVREGADRILALVLSPQWSDRLMRGYVEALEAVGEGSARGVELRVVRDWHREPAFIEAIAERIRDALAVLGDATRTRVILTAHSLPKRVFEAEPRYIADLRETAELVARRTGIPLEGWDWAYQSAGHTQEEWLRPDLKELFPALAARGYRSILVVPVQFLADHLEVLYDLDIAAASEARAAGLEYHRIEMPNTHPTFIAALADVIRRELASAVAR
jgi:ferrochelatase